MNILSKIVAHKEQEVLQRKANLSISELEQFDHFKRDTYSFRDSLLHPERTGIIAEFKRQSPSKGIINATAKVEQVTQAYQSAGASAISILTDEQFFGGKGTDLLLARPHLHIPVLRKDFIIDEYQVVETKAMGADIILLIAAIMSPQKLTQLAQQAKEIGLNILLEIHNEAELQHINPYIDAVGVNNRNLDTFETSIQTSFDLGKQIPDNYLKISESAIDEVLLIKKLKSVGFSGFLIGECFMKTENPAQKAQEFMQDLRS